MCVHIGVPVCILELYLRGWLLGIVALRSSLCALLLVID